MTASRYRAFISYSHKDRVWADWLHRALESYTVPKHLVGRHTSAGEVPARLAPVFRDREELASSTSLARQVNEALEQSANLVVICSPDSARSRWVNEEILAFKRLGRADRVFCLIVAGEPNAADRRQRRRGVLRPGAALRAWRGRPAWATSPPSRSPPIVRPGMDGKTDAKLKLIAGMLGLGLDGLKQREQHRRQRRMTAITALAVLVMAVTSVLAFKAVVAQHAAERRQKQAEDLVDFMLGDLDDKLREVNRLDILESVADKAMQYFASLPAGDVTEQATAERAKALQKIGSIRFDQGHLQPGLESFQAAEALNRALAAELPDNSQVQLQLAQSIAYVGLVRWQQGRLVEADKAFTEAHDILERALRRDPASIDLLAELANQSTNIGRLFETAGNLDAAAEKYREVLAINQRLSALQPGKPQWRSEIGYANNNLGKLAVTRGKLLEAAKYYQTDLSIKQELSAADPKNNQTREELATALLFTAKIRNQIGDSQKALEDADAALLLLEQLVRFDPSQSSYRYMAALGKKSRAVILWDLGRPREAEVSNGQSLRLLAELLRTEPDNLRRRLRQLDGQLLAANIALELGDRSRASRLPGEVLAALAKVPSDEVDPKEVARIHALALIGLAQAGGGTPESREHWLQAQAKLAPFMADSLDPELLEPWIRIAIALDTKPFPEQALQRLQDSGYARPGFVAMLRQAGIDYELRGPELAPSSIAGSE